MTALLAEFEQQGYRFRLDGDQVMVSGPDVNTEPDALARIRQRKQEILSELRLQAFIDLVRGFGAINHQILLHRQEIESQLDDGDIQALHSSDKADRQAWAQMLACRLSRERLQGIG